MKRPWYFIMMPGTKTNQSITLSETFICYVKCNIAKYCGASSDALLTHVSLTHIL